MEPVESPTTDPEPECADALEPNPLAAYRSKAESLIKGLI